MILRNSHRDLLQGQKLGFLWDIYKRGGGRGGGVDWQGYLSLPCCLQRPQLSILDRLGRVKRLSRGLTGHFKDVAPILIGIHFWKII